MRTQGVKKVVDALASQQRVIIYLTCGHLVSVTMRQMAAESRLAWDVKAATEWPCEQCPDRPPVVETTAERTPQQLWREAGEP